MTAIDRPPNKLQRSLMRLDEAPGFMRGWVQSIILRRAVPFAGTVGLRFTGLSTERAEVRLASAPRLHNQSGDVHTSAIHLLAESATGLVIGMNVRDDCTPVLKQSVLLSVQRAKGSLKAVAVLTPEQAAWMQANEQGELSVSVTVTDDTGAEPVQCEFVWAWVPASRPKKN